MSLSLRSFPMLLFIVMGCTQATETAVNTSVPPSAPWMVPRVGTRYVYQITSLIGKKSDTLFDTIAVIGTGLTRMGKTNVFATADKADTTLVSIEDNGDVSTADLLTPNPSWARFPTGGGLPISDPSVDSIRSDGARIKVTGVRSFIGQGTLGLLNTTYQSIHVREVDSNGAVSHSGNFSISTTAKDTWFIPAAGYIGSVHLVQADTSTSSSSSFTTDIQLVGYFPK